MADHYEFRADPFRRGLLAHCYRMLGSVREAEMLVRQTYQLAASRYDELAASRYSGAPGLVGPDGGAGSWLYGTATRYCLTTPDGHRPLPTGLGGPSLEPEGKLAERPEVLWLEPVPDELADDRYLGLEFVAALQYLPPQQRAVMILRDIQGWPTAEIAEVLDTSAFAVDSLLADARDQFNPRPGHTESDQHDLLERYARAFETYDVPAIVEMFTADAVWEMPPFTSWFRGAKNIGRLISTHCPAEGPGDQILVPIKANGQPGFAVYMRDPVENVHRAFQIQVLTLTVAGIIHAVAFFDVSLFDAFSLPDLFTGLPESFNNQRPRIHIELGRQNHDQGE